MSMYDREASVMFSFTNPGGETIREIKNMSGAHVELSRAPPPNPSEKFFIIRGNAEQIDNAQRMISEKIGLATSPMTGGTVVIEA